MVLSVRCMMVPASIHCPHCHASEETIRAWRAYAQIFYVCGKCDSAWTVDVAPTEQAPPDDVLAKIKRVLS